MKTKRNKFSFGIFQDANVVKIAELVSIDGNIKILRLAKTELSAPLYPKVTDSFQEELTAIESFKEPARDLGNLQDLDEIRDLDIPGAISGDEINLTPDGGMGVPETFSELGKDDVPSGLGDLQALLQTFPLEKGKIALNANDEQVSYYQFDSTFATTNIDKKLRSELLSKEEIKAKNYSLDYIINPNETGLAFVHRGRFELLDAIQDLNPIISKNRFFFNHVETNEIALMNMVRECYDLPSEDFVTLLYIGIDYIVGIVMKGKSHVKTFPIIITETEPEKKRMAIYSKVILEQDISNTPITQHVILAGEDVSEEDIEFFQKKGFYWDPPKRLELRGIELIEGEEEISNPELIAQYAIPISLAWKILDAKNENFFPSNILPQKIIESQKYFKIAWHGFAILGAIFVVSLWGTMINLQFKQDITSLKKDITLIQAEVNHVRRLVDQVNTVKSRMNEVQIAMDKVARLIGNKNQWHYLIGNLSRSFNNNRITWIGSLESRAQRFFMSGHTTRRRNIIEISKLFPNSTIETITSYEIEDIPLWLFGMSYSYEDPDVILAGKTLTSKPSIERSYKPVEIEAPDVEITVKEIDIVYSNILTEYFNGEVEIAYDQFSQFVSEYPNHSRAYNAGYFVGECLYRMGRFQEAIDNFKTVLGKKGYKTPDALMMLGNSYEQLADYDTALSYWDELVKKYPENELAKLARYKIANYKG